MQEQNLIGAFWILRNCSSWVLAISLYLLCIAILPVGREWFEGLPYNISWASQFGDLFLIGIIIIGSEILKSAKLNGGLPANTAHSQWLAIFICLAIGVVMQVILVRTRPEAMVMDTYHNIVVVPLLAYFLIAAEIVIFKYGTGDQKWWATLFLAVWLVLLILDAVNGRLDQQEWLQRHGIFVPPRY